jgi:hypothetical protein
MKINKKRIMSSGKHHGQPSKDTAQQVVHPPGHYRIVSHPVGFSPDILGNVQPVPTKSRKNLSSQQSQSRLRGTENHSEQMQLDNNGNPTQQILKLRAAALVPPQSMMVNKPNDKDLRGT